MATVVQIKWQQLHKCLLGGWGDGGEAWKWRRRLWVWEEALVEECRHLLLNVMLQVDTEDSWMWTPDTVEGYTVSGAYIY